MTLPGCKQPLSERPRERTIQWRGFPHAISGRSKTRAQRNSLPQKPQNANQVQRREIGGVAQIWGNSRSAFPGDPRKPVFTLYPRKKTKTMIAVRNPSCSRKDFLLRAAPIGRGNHFMRILKTPTVFHATTLSTPVPHTRALAPGGLRARAPPFHQQKD